MITTQQADHIFFERLSGHRNLKTLDTTSMLTPAGQKSSFQPQKR